MSIEFNKYATSVTMSTTIAVPLWRFVSLNVSAYRIIESWWLSVGIGGYSTRDASMHIELLLVGIRLDIEIGRKTKDFRWGGLP